MMAKLRKKIFHTCYFLTISFFFCLFIYCLFYPHPLTQNRSPI